MATAGNCMGGWQTGEASFREIAPLVIERIPGLEHGPPYAPGVVAKIAGLADSNRPTVYGVIRDLRDGRSLDDPLRAQGEPPTAASNGRHEPQAVTVEPVVTEKPVAPCPPARSLEQQQLRALLPQMYSSGDLAASFADFIGSLRAKVKTLESELLEARAAKPGPAADREAENALREDLGRQATRVTALETEREANWEAFDLKVQQITALKSEVASRDTQIEQLRAEVATKHATPEAAPAADSALPVPAPYSATAIRLAEQFPIATRERPTLTIEQRLRAVQLLAGLDVTYYDDLVNDLELWSGTLQLAGILGEAAQVL